MYILYVAHNAGRQLALVFKSELKFFLFMLPTFSYSYSY